MTCWTAHPADPAGKGCDMRKGFLAAFACAVLALPASASASGQWDSLLAPESACHGQSNASAPAGAQIRTMTCMHNYARTKEGLAKLHPARPLHASAQRKAHDLRRCQQFSHDACGRDPFYWFQRVGFLKGWYGAGENLALGNGVAATVRGTMSDWLNSDEHRSVLLDRRFDEVGFGLVNGSFQRYTGVAFWVAHFGYHSRPAPKDGSRHQP
jgi:uncharacterized protein YkwD